MGLNILHGDRLSLRVHGASGVSLAPAAFKTLAISSRPPAMANCSAVCFLVLTLLTALISTPSFSNLR